MFSRLKNKKVTQGKNMKPQDGLFEKHNVDRIAGSALTAQETKQHISDIGEVLSHPDALELASTNVLADRESLIRKLGSILSESRNLGFGKPGEYASSSSKDAEVRLFKPHEVVSSDTHPGVEFATSVIAMDMYPQLSRRSTESVAPVGQFILFKLGHAEEDLTSTNLQIGVNCQFGAIIEDDQIKPFKLEMQSGNGVVTQLERTDPTSATGTARDAQVIENGNDRMMITMIDVGEDFETHNAIVEELKTFVSSRAELATETK